MNACHQQRFAPNATPHSSLTTATSRLVHPYAVPQQAAANAGHAASRVPSAQQSLKLTATACCSFRHHSLPPHPSRPSDHIIQPDALSGTSLPAALLAAALLTAYQASSSASSTGLLRMRPHALPAAALACCCTACCCNTGNMIKRRPPPPRLAR